MKKTLATLKPLTTAEQKNVCGGSVVHAAG